MHRPWKVALALAAGVLPGVALWLLLRPAAPLGIGRSAYKHIQEGMTPAEVEAVIGLPPGDYRSDPGRPGAYAELPPGPGFHILGWVNDDCNIQVRVDGRTGRVDIKIMGEPILSPSTLRRAWEDFRSWLDL